MERLGLGEKGGGGGERMRLWGVEGAKEEGEGGIKYVNIYIWWWVVSGIQRSEG